MTEQRKRAYSHLLYIYSVQMRGTGFSAFLAIWNPFNWRKIRRDLLMTHGMSDAIHNLAEFASRDFEGFDEEHFWRDVRSNAEYYGYEETWRPEFERALEVETA
ncbi:MAG TPA: hypothetical protein VEJ63_11800 [Planctomycetota bacterium]|nr:hypothetical protein [Planctomycetota bacterium]